MKRRVISKISTIIPILLCVLMVLNSSAVAVKNSPDALKVDDIVIFERCGIVEGQTVSLTATLKPESASKSAVKWSSSNPDVISCTDDGVIKGISAGGYADITCKAKFGSANDTVRIYCVESIGNYVKNDFVDYVTFVYAQPSTGKISAVYLNHNKIFQFFANIFKWLAGAGVKLPSLTSSASMPNAFEIASNVCEVRGKYNSYAYVAVGTKSGGIDGFVKYTKLEQSINSFLNLSATDMDIWADGSTYENRKLTTTYKGDVRWDVENNDYIDFNESTGQIVGKVPGKITTITAKADGMTAKCTVHLLYKWPQSWTTQTNKTTSLYKAEGKEYKVLRTLPSGAKFVVMGDCGTDNGWAYGYYPVGEVKHWGYIPINQLSTKETISQYSSLGWTWPVRDVKNGVNQTTRARYISSPYGWRDDEPIKHKGIDITNGVSSNSDFANSVDGYEVVSAFAGKVIYVCEDKYKSCGYCIAIRSTEKDPITGKYYVAIYMHLKYIPDVELNENVSSNKKLGCVGSTGNSGGSHLHFEVNNQNLSYGQKIYYENDSDKEMVFGSVINPLFFYMNYYNLPKDDPYKIIVNPDCAAMNYRKPLWYGDDIKESKEP